MKQKVYFVHHIHVKFGEDTFTIFHDGACIDLTDLQAIVNQILFHKTGFRDLNVRPFFHNIKKKDK